MIDDPNVTVLFEKTKIGPNTLAQMLPALCKLADTNAPYANHTLRATGIVLLKEAGFSDRDICKLSGHRNEASLSHYDPGNSIEKKASMAHALLLGAKRKPSEEKGELESPPVKKLSVTSTITSEAYQQSEDFCGFRRC